MKKDFDTYLIERKKKTPHSFKMFGETYALAPTIPFEAMLIFKRMSQDENKDRQVSETEIVDLIEAIIGKDLFAHLRAHADFDIDLMTQFLTYLVSCYTTQSDTEDSEETTVKKGKV